MHDGLTGEFVNVGVVTYVPSTGRLQFKTRVTIGRLKGVFRDIDRSAFASSMYGVRRSRIAKSEAKAGFFKSSGDAASIARQAVPQDDSSLQWSVSGTGLTEDPDKTLERLFERFVSRYDTPSRADGIKSKAREWLGHLSAVVSGGQTEQFEPHFIVGRPTNPALENAYRSAIAILGTAPNGPEIFEETQLDALVAKLEDEVHSHH